MKSKPDSRRISCADPVDMTVTEPPKLTANEKQALTAWRDTDSDFDVLSFKTIERRSGLAGHLIRRTVRNMARKGITKFVRGCWTDDGEPAGSGYGLTPEGRSMLPQD